VVSRTVYSGTASTVTVGQALPGGGTAIADGSFPNVFKNETPDASFGVTSGIFLDQLTSSGVASGTSLAVNPGQIVTSFASKSELGLNISTDGTAVSFMGYLAPVNALDVSNSNTSAVFDPTNPVSSTFQRGIATVDLNSGNLSVTGVNAYSGNNGRAAILAGGNYYMVGNAGNSGTGTTNTTLSQLSDNTGVQMIAAGSSGNTSVVGQVQGTFGTSTGYQRGFSTIQTGAAADKTGKDDNFRGMTVFNNTLFVTKGSGSNGINTVYQVGAAGSLPTSANAGSTSITILPGFSTALAKNASAAVEHPFGLWFGDSSTLFVADEGDGVRIGQVDKNGVAVQKFTNNSGLQEYKLVNGTWQLAATFQQGLLTQTSYTGGLPWNVYTDGLRNISGQKNADGSFTIFGTTSTVSDEQTHDLGADPNELVSITIGANSTAANTSFSVLETASAGQRLGGVAVVPVPEPETYALMMIGLGLVGFAARRRAKGARA
jgi:hypothetical protein